MSDERFLEIITVKREFIDAVLAGAKACGAGFATSGLIGAGAGAGIIFGGMVFGLSKNPRTEKLLFRYAILGFALTEAIGLMALLMAFLILFI